MADMVCDATHRETSRRENIMLILLRHNKIEDMENKCTGTGCIIRDTCHRFTSERNPAQSYFTTPPLVFIDENNMECEMYYSNENQNIVKQQTQKNEGII